LKRRSFPKKKNPSSNINLSEAEILCLPSGLTAIAQQRLPHNSKGIFLFYKCKEESTRKGIKRAREQEVITPINKGDNEIEQQDQKSIQGNIKRHPFHQMAVERISTMTNGK
jgi:hypothetical protein